MKQRPSTIFLQSINPLNLGKYFVGLKNDFGMKFTLLMTSTFFGIKGTTNEFGSAVQYPYYLKGNWDNKSFQNNSGVSGLPWSIKGIGGVITDCLPILGYEKTSWMLIFTFLGFVSILILAAVPMSAENISDKVPMVFFFLINIQTAFSDLLVEGKFINLMKRCNENRGNAVSFAYLGENIGSIIAVIFTGVLSDKIDPRYALFIALPFSFQPAIFLFFGCMIEDKADPMRNNRIDMKKVREKGGVMFMGVFSAIIALMSFLFGAFGSELANFVFSIVACIAQTVVLYITIPVRIANALFYVFLAFALYLSIDGTMLYFYQLDCIVDGPKFNFTYIQSIVGVIGFLASIVGVWLFQAILVYYSYRTMFWTTTAIKVFVSLVDIVIVERWNVAIGIPDEVMYLFGSGVVYKIAYQLDFMPCALILAKVAPKTIETAMFSVASGYVNYGWAINKFLGNYVTVLLNIHLENDKCVYGNLSWLILISHIILPLLTIPLTFVLIPNKYVSENFADGEFDDIKYAFRKKKEIKA